MEENFITSYLRRYTDLTALINILSLQKITLLDPKTWDDRNDSFFMSIYKERNNLKTLLALCFSQTVETYHHWRVFSNGPAGVCIVFDRSVLLESIQKLKQGILRTESIKYLTLRDAKYKQLKTNELPFVKRHGYRPEKEFRIIYESTVEELSALDIPIPLNSIRSISLSPWMHHSLSKSTAASIRAIKDCSNIRVSRSTLISNEEWKAFGKNSI